MKKYFCVDDYFGKDVAMHCETEEEAVSFLGYLDSFGLTWNSGISYLTRTNYNRFKSDTCYNFNHGVFDQINYYIENEYLILEYKDFDWADCHDKSIDKDTFFNLIFS